MKSIQLILGCALLFGCDPNIYRVKTESSMCDSVAATDCSSAPNNPNRIRLCGSAFANRSDFVSAAHQYCTQPVVQNCAVQCCEVICPAGLAPNAPPATVATPPAPATPESAIPTPGAADDMPPPPPPPPPAPAAATPEPKATLAPVQAAPPAATVAPVAPAAPAPAPAH